MAIVLALGAYLRLADLDFGQFRSDDVALWNIARDLAQQPRILTRAMPSSAGLSNGPFQAYLLLPAALVSNSPSSALLTVALLNVAGVALFWAFVRRYWGREVALLATLLYALNPWAVVFSRRVWAQDLVAPFTVLLIWSLCDLARKGRRRDSVLPLLWLALSVQMYVAAFVHVLVAALGYALGVRHIRARYLVLGIAVFGGLTAPYLVGTVVPGLSSVARLAGAGGTAARVDSTSMYFMFDVVSSGGYQAFANQAGRIANAGTGLPSAVSLVAEALLAIGLGVGVAEVLRSARRRSLAQATPYALAVAAVLLPMLLFVRHTTPVYPYYLLVGFPMHFLLIALGLRWVWCALRAAAARWRPAPRRLPGLASASLVALIAGTHLFMAQVFFVAAREYWPAGDYGLPLRYTLDVAEMARKLVREEGITSVYLGGPGERDAVLYQILASDFPHLAHFDSGDTFVWPDRDAGKVLYVLSSSEDRVGRAFADHLGSAEVASLDVPGHGLRYSFWVVPAGDLAGLFPGVISTPVSATLDGRVRLDGVSVDAELQPGSKEEVVLSWTLLKDEPPSGGAYRAYLRLMERSREADHGIEFPFYAVGRWQRGEQILMWRSLAAPSNLEAGVYSYLLGLYAPTATGYRNALAVDARGNAIGEGVRFGKLAVRAGAEIKPSHGLDVELGQKVVLVGYDLAEHFVAGGTASISLYWKARDRLDHDYTAFVHLLDPGGKLVAQHDSQPDMGRYPTSAWLPGDVIADRHSFPLPAGLAPGRYALEVGLYDLLTGERLGGSDRAVVFPVTVE